MVVIGRKERSRVMEIDFTNCKVDPSYLYGGSNGKKIGIEYNGEMYMLKFPNKIDKKDGEYSNSIFSEHIACQIFKSMGFEVQETLLGSYTLGNGICKDVVACKDFTVGGYVLKEFAELKNSVITTSNSGYGTDLEEVLETIKEQTLVDSNALMEYFWCLFIGDALLGNFDRHNGNWGFLIKRGVDEVKFAPIYDCCSCLYPQLDDKMMEIYLQDENELEKRTYIFPNSALKLGGNKINYYEFINSLTNKDCNKALLKVYPRIDLKRIDDIIDRTANISSIRKEFYKTIVKKRYECILTPAYKKLLEKQGE